MEKLNNTAKQLEIIENHNTKCSQCNHPLDKDIINKKYLINNEGMFEPICDNCFWDAVD